METHTQSIIENSRTWHDLNSLSQLRSQGDSKEAITEAAKQFESVFFSMMMKSMRDAANAVVDKPFFDSPSLDLFQDMYDKQLSIDVSGGNDSKLGLAEVLVEQLTRGKTFKEINQDTLTENSAPQLLQRQEFTVQHSLTHNTNVAKQSEQVRNQFVDKVEVGQVSGPDRLVDSMPTEMKGMDFSSPAAFVQSLLPYAKHYADKLKMDPKLMLAQAALETGWGKFVMRTIDGVSSNNLFGIKADRSWQGDAAHANTLEFQQGELKKTKASFRAYSNHEESFRDYIEFIKSNSRYEKAIQATNNPKNYLQELQSAGYATDPNYADKIIQIYRSKSFNNAFNTASLTSMR